MELKGKYPKIFDDKVVGNQAKELFQDANALIDEIIEKNIIRANAAYGFWPAASSNDDVILYTDEDRSNELARFHFLRLQWERKGQKDFRCLSDYIAPVESGRADYIGGFVVTAGIGADDFANEFKAQHDDYRAIMVQAVADRFAEAFAELLHEQPGKTAVSVKESRSLKTISSMSNIVASGRRPDTLPLGSHREANPV